MCHFALQGAGGCELCWCCRAGQVGLFSPTQACVSLPAERPPTFTNLVVLLATLMNNPPANAKIVLRGAHDKPAVRRKVVDEYLGAVATFVVPIVRALREAGFAHEVDFGRLLPEIREVSGFSWPFHLLDHLAGAAVLDGVSGSCSGSLWGAEQRCQLSTVPSQASCGSA